SPARTLCPSRTCSSNPSPPRPTVSIPTCNRISAPLSARKVTACLDVGTTTRVPSQGACSDVPVGSIATPSPIICPANTASGASSSGELHPCSGDNKISLDGPTSTPPAGPSRAPTSDRAIVGGTSYTDHGYSHDE